MEVEIETITSQINVLTSEISILERQNEDMLGAKSFVAQSVLSLSECRTILRAVLNCIDDRKASELELHQLRGSIERIKSEMQRMSEGLFRLRSEATALRDELVKLEGSYHVANENSGSLRINLSKLQAKLGTHKARATGAEKDLIAYQKETSSQATHLTEEFSFAERELIEVITEGSNSANRLLLTKSLIDTEIINIMGFMDRQVASLDQIKRLRLSAA